VSGAAAVPGGAAATIAALGRRLAAVGLTADALLVAGLAMAQKPPATAPGAGHHDSDVMAEVLQAVVDAAHIAASDSLTA